MAEHGGGGGKKLKQKLQSVTLKDTRECATQVRHSRESKDLHAYCKFISILVSEQAQVQEEGYAR